MKTNRWVKVGVWFVGLAFLLAVSAIAERAWANSSSFSWRMNNRQINGNKNGRFHMLDAGVATIEGDIEVTERLRGSVSTPISVTLSLFKVGTFSDDFVCSVTVVPESVVGAIKKFSKRCVHITSGKYWVRVKKDTSLNPDGDGWHNRGTGTVSTQ